MTDVCLKKGIAGFLFLHTFLAWFKLHFFLILAKLQDYGSILSLSAPDISSATQLSSGDVAILQKTVANVIMKKLPVVKGKLYYKCYYNRAV
jgi:hypothetical protein